MRFKSSAQKNPLRRGVSSHRHNKVVELYMRETRRIPQGLTYTDEMQLCTAIRRGDHDAYRKLVESNLAFVIQIATKYTNNRFELSDLISEGNLGLIEAAKRFDHNRGVKFITYAVWWIHKQIHQYIDRTVSIVQTPKYRTVRRRDIRSAEHALMGLLYRRPTRDEIAQRMNRKTEWLERFLLDSPHPAETGNDGENKFDTSALERQADPADTAENRMIFREQIQIVIQALAKLDQRSRTVLSMRFGLDGKPPMTLHAIGHAIGLSRERARQIEDEAKKSLQLPIRRLLKFTGKQSRPAFMSPRIK